MKAKRDGFKFALLCMGVLFVLISVGANISQSHTISRLTKENTELMQNYQEVSQQFDQLDSLVNGLIYDVNELTKRIKF